MVIFFWCLVFCSVFPTWDFGSAWGGVLGISWWPELHDYATYGSLKRKKHGCFVPLFENSMCLDEGTKWVNVKNCMALLHSISGGGRFPSGLS